MKCDPKYTINSNTIQSHICTLDAQLAVLLFQEAFLKQTKKATIMNKEIA